MALSGLPEAIKEKYLETIKSLAEESVPKIFESDSHGAHSEP